MGIALAHNAFAENDGASDFDANHNYQTYLNAIQSGGYTTSYTTITPMFNYIWATIKKMGENKKDVRICSHQKI
jgi:hypothetical protein